MKPEWRTSTVVQICAGMRQERDYSALPILADALQDAGCEDEKFLESLRSGPDEIEAGRLTCIVYSPETERAVARIEQFAVDLGPRAFCEEGDGYDNVKKTTYARLIRVGNRYTTVEKDGWHDYTTEHGSADLRNENDEFFAEFWADYALITGRTAEGNPFSCSC